MLDWRLGGSTYAYSISTHADYWYILGSKRFWWIKILFLCCRCKCSCWVFLEIETSKKFSNAISGDVAYVAARGDGAGGCGNTISQTNAWTPRLAMSIKLIKHIEGRENARLLPVPSHHILTDAPFYEHKWHSGTKKKTIRVWHLQGLKKNNTQDLIEII